MEVADLLVELRSNIDRLHQCIQSLSDTSSHDAELERLATEREAKIEELRQSHEEKLKQLDAEREKENAELNRKRLEEEECLDLNRKKELEEVMERRRGEDEERSAKFKAEGVERERVKREEDEEREQERVNAEKGLQEKAEVELDRLEDEMERRAVEEKEALRELVEKRKAINAQIDAALHILTAIPTIHFRSRAKTIRDSKQKDISQALEEMPALVTLSEPVMNGSKDIFADSDTNNVDETKETTVTSKAEYGYSPMETSNFAIFDYNAESTINKNTETTEEAEAKSAGMTSAIEEPAEAKVQSGDVPPVSQVSDFSEANKSSRELKQVPAEIISCVSSRDISNTGDAQEESIDSTTEEAEKIFDAKADKISGVEESTIEKASTPTPDANSALEGKSTSNSEVPGSIRPRIQEFTGDSLHLEESDSTTVPESKEILGHSALPVPHDVSSVGGNTQVSEVEDLADNGAHLVNESPQNINQRTSQDAAPIAAGIDKIGEDFHLSKNDDEHEHRFHIADTDTGTPSWEPYNPDLSELSHPEGAVLDSAHDIPDINDEYVQQTPEVLPLSQAEDIESHGTRGNEEGSPICIEEIGPDLSPDTVEKLEIQTSNCLHDQEHESRDTLTSLGEDLTSNHEGIFMLEATQSGSVTADNPLSHAEIQGAEPADDSRIFANESTKEPADERDDILDEYISNGSDLNVENQSENHGDKMGEDWPKEPAIADVTEQGIPNERPATPAKRSSDIEFIPKTPWHLSQEENHLTIAQSPATVLSADDLFAGDNDEEENHLPADRPKNEKDIGYDTVKEEDRTRYPEPAHNFQRYENDRAGSRNPAQSLTPDHRSSGFFASLLDAMTPDLPLVGQIINYNSSPAYHYLDEDQSISEYSETTPGERQTVPYLTQESESAQNIRTCTVNTIHSFESDAQSDDTSIPTSSSETVFSPFQENSRDEPNIRSSWQDKIALQGSDPVEPRGLKLQASPLRAEFDPYSSEIYSNYILPDGSQSDLTPEVSPISKSFRYVGGINNSHAYSPHGSISASWTTKSPRISALNTTQASQFSEGRPSDSPVSATRSNHKSETKEPSSPTLSRIPRRPADNTISTTQTPASSPSISRKGFFQKKRSFSESGSTQSRTPPSVPRPLSSLFNVNRGPPSPPRRSSFRPSSLVLISPGEDTIIPRSLDKDGKPPSPVFTLTTHKTTDENTTAARKRSSNSFLGGLSKLLGSGGLDESMHNSNRGENDPLLWEERNGAY